MSILHLLNREARWERDVPTGTKGKFTLALTLVDAALPCRIAVASTRDSVVGFQENTIATHLLYTEPAVELRRGDWLTIDAVRYKLLAKQAPSKPEHHLRWQVQEEQTTSGVSPDGY